MMVVKILFRHMETDSQAEKIVNDHVREVRNFNLEYLRMIITIERLNKVSYCCHILFRASDRMSADIYITRSDVLAAVAGAFESLNKNIERKLIRRNRSDSDVPYEYIVDEFVGDFEDMYDAPPPHPLLLPVASIHSNHEHKK